MHRRSSFHSPLIEIVPLGFCRYRNLLQQNWLSNSSTLSRENRGRVKDDQPPAPLPMARIVNSSKLTARRAVGGGRASRHFATQIHCHCDPGCTRRGGITP